jgi:uncharacterized protein involved in exopolysaccharide biosynthesis
VGEAQVTEERSGPPISGIVRQVALVAVLTVAGALIAIGVVQARGVSYEATAKVRAPTADATCIFFQCTQPVPTSAGNPYVLDQANAIESRELAGRVRRTLTGFKGTGADLAKRVTAKEIGASPTIAITYRASSRAAAQVIAGAYATQYVAWSNQQALSSLTALEGQLDVLFRDEFQGNSNVNNSLRGVTFDQARASIAAAMASYRAAIADKSGTKSGPNGARIYDPGSQPEAVRTTPGTVKTAALGGAAGLVFGIGLVLMIPSIGGWRRGPAAEPDRPVAQPALVRTEIDEPVR